MLKSVIAQLKISGNTWTSFQEPGEATGKCSPGRAQLPVLQQRHRQHWTQNHATKQAAALLVLFGKQIRSYNFKNVCLASHLSQMLLFTAYLPAEQWETGDPTLAASQPAFSGLVFNTITYEYAKFTWPSVTSLTLAAKQLYKYSLQCILEKKAMHFSLALHLKR